ncbi:hypothetical protein CHLRE_03g178014v5 [Chlamydomonas reinhardtii]|uniref:Uncharacterized protein n=1 Tax=Chlamydomonas reinhardtii TaxID=3055 RepID=A0A2K3DXI8_CHLRE|nr:uncharacterized protein CHLRE_03g178014v5 [Chlamydomonas reinhardtii]PNW85253.1 hypothetical protein CHLRE_03g178014v5 [Chlamydomonas reinhardtii]
MLALITPILRQALPHSRAVSSLRRGPLQYATNDLLLQLEESTDADKVCLAVTLEESAVESIGDPVEVKVPAAGTITAQGAPVAQVSWEGFLRSEGDELYHAVWTNAKGVYNVTLPFAARVTQQRAAAVEPGDLLLPQAERPFLVHVEVDAWRWRASLESGAVTPLL